MHKKSQGKKSIFQHPGRYNVRDVRVEEFSYEKQLNDRMRLEKILKVLGKHNIQNALAALTAARELGIADEISFKALAEFSGAWRRFEEIGNYKGATVISDYAHNPQKIMALADALLCKIKKEKQRSGIILVFQPHHQKRLETLFDDFVNVFGEIARGIKIIITDVYEVSGREKSKISARGGSASGGKNEKLKTTIKNSKLLVEAINKKYPKADIVYVPKNKLKQWLINKFQVPGFKFQVLCFAGAGDIDTLAREILNSKQIQIMKFPPLGGSARWLTNF